MNLATALIDKVSRQIISLSASIRLARENQKSVEYIKALRERRFQLEQMLEWIDDEKRRRHCDHPRHTLEELAVCNDCNVAGTPMTDDTVDWNRS